MDRSVTPVAVTAVVLTLNESELLSRCLSRLAWADEILVVDSGSTDGTRELAQSLGARVLEQPWLGWSGQRNAGAAAARNDWIFFVEADEYVTPGLESSIRGVLGASPDARDGYAIDRRDEFMGRLMPQAQRKSSVISFVRLYNRRESRWDPNMLVHERVLLSGQRHVLEGVMVHWRRQTLIEQAHRVVRYSDIEARAFDEHHGRPSVPHLVLQPLFRFCWLYFVRREFLLGRRGLIHAALRASADFMRHARHFEMHVGETPVHPPAYKSAPADSDEVGRSA